MKAILSFQTCEASKLLCLNCGWIRLSVRCHRSAGVVGALGDIPITKGYGPLSRRLLTDNYSWNEVWFKNKGVTLSHSNQYFGSSIHY